MRDFILLLEGHTNPHAARAYNRIRLAEKMPMFANYYVYMSQPPFWIAELYNFYQAEEAYQKKHNG